MNVMQANVSTTVWRMIPTAGGCVHCCAHLEGVRSRTRSQTTGNFSDADAEALKLKP
jgi:hypothetical protein